MNAPMTLALSDSSTNRAHDGFDLLATHFRDALETACGSPVAEFGARVRTALDEATPLVDLLPADALMGCAERYTRHLLACDPAGRFAAAALIWRPGQMTPVHGHHTWCGYRVARGTLTEELFAIADDDKHAKRTGIRLRAAGASSFVAAGFEGIHRLTNHGDDIAVSLHVYGVHADVIATRVNQIVEIEDPIKAA